MFLYYTIPYQYQYSRVMEWNGMEWNSVLHTQASNSYTVYGKDCQLLAEGHPMYSVFLGQYN